ncbi:hypothetical protein MM239_12755 [Belliella sp. DSM 111904]|uniref:Uncharacterized protein n=1 Tax=Belliella filtrata TaxID=2923435 RepID=A0ABS9V1H4_9BACT|nr:hypothetical protein [Belliella filtrata]MCH7410270.1 hypothetical protein [Belliella filtrata]
MYDFGIYDGDITFSREVSNGSQLMLTPRKEFEEDINYVLSVPLRKTIPGLQYHGSRRDFLTGMRLHLILIKF